MNHGRTGNGALQAGSDTMVTDMIAPMCWKAGAILVDDGSNKIVVKDALKLIEYVELVSVQEIAQLVAANSVVPGHPYDLAQRIKAAVPRWRDALRLEINLDIRDTPPGADPRKQQ
jgi:hypothetical protein